MVRQTKRRCDRIAAFCDLALARVIIRRFSPGFKTNESYVYARACWEWNIGKVRKTREEATRGRARGKTGGRGGGRGDTAVESRRGFESREGDA